MDDTLTVPIGVNVTADGGPFSNFEADPDSTDTEEGIIRGHTGETQLQMSFDLDTLEEWLTDEMEGHEAIHLSLGDVGGPIGLVVGTVDLPLVDGYIVTVHRLPGQGVDKVANLGRLAQEPNRLRHFERQLQRYGGDIEG